MSYFLLTQTDINNCITINFSNEKEIKEDHAVVKYISYRENMIVPDYIHTKIVFTHAHLVSESFRKLLHLYEPSLLMRPVFLTNVEKKKQFLYWQIKESPIACLKTEGSYKKVASLPELKNKFFFVGKLEKAEFLIADVHVIESILRRNPIGITYQEIEQEVLESGGEV